ncbi:SIS domain-containing protein [Actinomycetota bacterium]
MNDDTIMKKASYVWDIASLALKDLINKIDTDSFLKCVKKIAGCKGRIITSGSGTSGAAAKKISHSLSCIERPSFFLSPSDAVHGALGSVQKNDIAILISKGGNTTEIINMIPSLKKKEIFIIGVTENKKSILASKSDLLLKIMVDKEADDFNMLATTSTMAVVAVFDAVCICLMKYMDYSKEKFAIIHPKGAVGERLQKEKY